MVKTIFYSILDDYKTTKIIDQYNQKQTEIKFEYICDFYPKLDHSLPICDHYFSIDEFLYTNNKTNFIEFDKIMNKEYQKSVCEKIGHFLPDYYNIIHLKNFDINNVLSKLPLIIKSTSGSGGDHFRVLHNADDYEKYINHFYKNDNDKYIIESYIEGTEYIADFLIHPFEKPLLIGYWKYVYGKNEGKYISLPGIIV